MEVVNSVRLIASMTGIGHLTPSDVPLGAGRPTREELLVHYPAKFTWHELKTFINAGYATSPSPSIDTNLLLWYGSKGILGC